MMLIDCPFCGPRDETEFSCGGEAHIARPLAENKISDAEFADYLFMRDNPIGKPKTQGFLRIDGAAGENHIHCAALSD